LSYFHAALVFLKQPLNHVCRRYPPHILEQPELIQLPPHGHLIQLALLRDLRVHDIAASISLALSRTLRVTSAMAAPLTGAERLS
jgi:hypothetical protein